MTATFRAAASRRHGSNPVQIQPVQLSGTKGILFRAMPDPSTVRIAVDRQGVCMGDDAEAHNAVITVDASCDVIALLEAARRACRLAFVSGGRAKWLVEIGKPGESIGGVAEQWAAPRLLIPETTAAADLFSGRVPSMYFRYWCQSDPDAVFHALRTGSPLPPR